MVDEKTDVVGQEAGQDEQQAAEDLSKALAGSPDASPDPSLQQTPEEAETKDAKPDSTEGEGDEARADEPAVPESPTLTKKQEEAVKAVGLTPEKVLAMGEEGIALANRLAKQRSDLSRFASEAGRRRKEQPADKSKPSEKSPEAASTVAEITDEDVFEERERPKLNANFKNIEQRLAALEARSSEGPDTEGQKERDEFFTSLGNEWPQFGEGSMGDLFENSPEAIARNEVVERAVLLMRQDGNMTLQEGMTAALASLYPEEYGNAATRRAMQKSASRRRGSIEPPTGRKATKAAGDEIEEARVGLEESLRGIYR